MLLPGTFRAMIICIRADSAKRGCAICFVTLASSALSDSFFDFFLGNVAPTEPTKTVVHTFKARSGYRAQPSPAREDGRHSSLESLSTILEAAFPDERYLSQLVLTIFKFVTVM
jgi:hypothetical protein